MYEEPERFASDVFNVFDAYNLHHHGFAFNFPRITGNATIHEDISWIDWQFVNAASAGR